MLNFAQARAKMVDNQLRPEGITDRALLAAMGDLPRERFVPSERAAIAYSDHDHPLGVGGRVLSSPATFARLAQLAEIKPQDFVLDIGCGTGYSSAILAELAGSVIGVDADAALIDAATENLSALEIGNATFVAGDPALGLPAEAPFDVIIIEGALTETPQSLFNQLREGGRLVAIIEQGAASTASVFVKSGSDVTSRAAFNVALPPLSTSAQPATFSL